MIGNKYLKGLFASGDENTGINQLLELLKSRDESFIDSLYEPVDLEECNDKELRYLTIISALIDYYMQIYGIKVPGWLRDERLRFDKPYYHTRRISDFDKFKLLYTNPSPLKVRNVYFDMDGIQRV